MGLDTVELVMRIEETFDITIPDAEAEKIQTIGQLYHYLLARFHGEERVTSRCLSAATFYGLRRGLMRSFRTPRREVRPESALETLIPAMGRRSEWKRLGEKLGWELPALVRPDWVAYTFLGLLVPWAAVVFFAWVQLAGLAMEAAIPMGICFVAGSVMMGVLLSSLTEPFATHLPPECANVRSMVTVVLTQNLGKIRGTNPEGWNRKEVWEIVLAIVADQAGVSPDQLTESTSFVNDLGMD